MDPVNAASSMAASALFAQSMRMRIVAENMANAQSTGAKPGADPYQRKTVSFAEVLDGVTEQPVVQVADVGRDTAPFPVEKMPWHPAADAEGNVKMPNVNMIVEMADMRQAARSYEANVQVIKQSHDMANTLIDLLRGQ